MLSDHGCFPRSCLHAATPATIAENTAGFNLKHARADSDVKPRHRQVDDNEGRRVSDLTTATASRAARSVMVMRSMVQKLRRSRRPVGIVTVGGHVDYMF